jgi:phosphatidylethanolamine/phosphatidyl-N-methylethanolamine N-methyltransferase
VNWTEFISEFIRKPAVTGSLIPSSPYLAEEMISQAGLENADAVLEYGPGTGAFTGHILRALRPDTKFAAIEINPRFAAIFRTTYPDVCLFEDSAANVRAICDSMQIASVDCVISGLPWALFDESLQIELLNEMMRVLKPSGRFVTFGYLQSLALPGTKRLLNLLPSYFTNVSRSPLVWLNLPPAFVYKCSR